MRALTWQGKRNVAVEDVQSIAHPVLRHRILTSFSAAAEGITSDFIVDRLLEEIAPGGEVGAGVPGLADAPGQAS